MMVRGFCNGEEDCEGGWCAYCHQGHESPIHLRYCTVCGAEKPQGDPDGHDYSEVNNLSKEALEYLKDVWEYNTIQEMDPLTASCILENVRENPEWELDKELWEAYCALHPEIRPDISFREFGATMGLFPIDPM